MSSPTTHGPRAGVVSGLALGHIRRRIGATQAELAEQLGVDVNTWKAWETARRPLPRASAGAVHELKFHLKLLGAQAPQLNALDDAMRADWILERVVARPHPRRHPLAHEVLTKDMTALLAWPLTGHAPRAFANDVARPPLGTAERATVYDALRAAAEQSLAGAGKHGPLLRRQVYYLLASDPASQGWLREATCIEHRRRPRLDRWTPEWVATRSLAVSRAVAGNPEPLREFLDHGLCTDETLAANLNYWANWIGEDAAVHRSDEFMAGGDVGGWRGGALLASLTRNLHRSTPYLELCIRSVWALLSRRRQLAEDRQLAGPLADRVRRLLDTPRVLSPGARKDLEQIDYVVSWRR